MATNTHVQSWWRLALTPIFVVAIAAGVAAQSDTAMVKYSATATNLDPSIRLTASFVDIRVTRWSTDAEREGLIKVLFEKGQGKLLRALQDLPRVGTIKTPDSLAYDLHYA